MFHRKGDPFLTLNIGKMEKAIIVNIVNGDNFESLSALNDLLSEGWKVRMIVPDHPSSTGGIVIPGHFLVILEKNKS